MFQEEIKAPLLIVGVGLLMGILGDYLFYGWHLGISFPLFVIALIGAAAVVLRSESQAVERINLWLLPPLLFLAAMAAVRAAPLLEWINIGGSLLLIGLLAAALRDKPFTHLTVGDYLAAGLATVFSTFAPLHLLRMSVASMRESENTTAATARRIGLGVLLALPFLCLFTLLFSSADLVFNKLLADALSAFDLPTLFTHAVVIAVITWMAASVFMLTLFAPYIRSSLRPTNDDEETDDADEEEKSRPQLGILETSIVLYSIDALFTVFVVIQFATLFGGEAFLQRQGLTISEYARRGFFELLTVAVIVLSLLLVLDFLAQRDTPRHRTLFIAGGAIMLGLTVVMLVSAFQRMVLYEEIFGFTRLRLHTHVFIAWMAVLLLAFLYLMLRQQVKRFPLLILVFCIGYSVTLNLLNPDRFIAEQNIRRWQNGEELDTDYLAGLSEDAVPILAPLMVALEEDADLERGLSRTYNTLDDRRTEYRWPFYHVSKQRAYTVLQPLADTYDWVGAPSER